MDRSNGDDADSNSSDQQHGPGGPLTSGAVPRSFSDEPEPTTAADSGANGPQQMEPFINNIPVFLDRTFRMIESVSDDIVSWSDSGDSFIIKQAREGVVGER